MLEWVMQVEKLTTEVAFAASEKLMLQAATARNLRANMGITSFVEINGLHNLGLKLSPIEKNFWRSFLCLAFNGMP